MNNENKLCVSLNNIAGIKNELLKFYIAHCVLDDDAYDEIEFTLEHMTNPDMRRVFAEHASRPRDDYSEVIKWGCE